MSGWLARVFVSSAVRRLGAIAAVAAVAALARWLA